MGKLSCGCVSSGGIQTSVATVILLNESNIPVTFLHMLEPLYMYMLLLKSVDFTWSTLHLNWHNMHGLNSKRKMRTCRELYLQ